MEIVHGSKVYFGLTPNENSFVGLPQPPEWDLL